MFRRLLITCAVLSITSQAFAQKTLTDGIKDLATQISASATKEQKKRVAVLSFKELDGQTTVLGTYLAEELLSHLVNSGLKVVERSMLDRLLGEQKLQQTGAIDPATAKEVGKVAGVDAIVTGTVTDLQSSVGINCRIIDTATGEIFAAAQTKITKDDDVKKIMAITVQAAPPTTRPGVAQKTSAANVRPVYQWGDLKLVVDAISRSGNLINVTFAVENDGTKEQHVRLGEYHLVDENGERWKGTTAAEGHRRDSLDVAPGTRRRIRWKFEPEGDASGTTFSLVMDDGKLLIRSLRTR